MQERRPEKRHCLNYSSTRNREFTYLGAQASISNSGTLAAKEFTMELLFSMNINMLRLFDPATLASIGIFLATVFRISESVYCIRERREWRRSDIISTPEAE